MVAAAFLLYGNFYEKQDETMKFLKTMTRRRLAAGSAAVALAIALTWLLEGVARGLLGPVGGALLAGSLVLAAVFAAGDAQADRNDVINLVSHSIDDIMIGAAETSYFVDSVKKKIEKDVETANTVVQDALSVARGTVEIADHAERALAIAVAMRSESVAGRAQIDEGLARISSARHEAQDAARLMHELQGKSRAIAGFTKVIAEISGRTNLLALNAAIGAARAGEHGRGFAVVAAEVRQLALRANEATDEISTMVKGINEHSERAAGGMDSLAGVVHEATTNVERVHTQLSHIEKSSIESEQQIGKIAREARMHVETTGDISRALAEIRDSMLSTDKELPRATDSAMALVGKAEDIAGALSESSAETPHDAIRVAAQETAAQIGQLFSEAIKAGKISPEALFDRRYTPIPNTNPPKYTTKFDSFTDRVLPPIQERLLERMPQLAFAGAVDNNGYFPTHNKKFSKPLTGNYDADIATSRTKRIFDDRTGARCGSNTKPFVLQTYKRDTGEVMHDLSAPIYVDGKHWGGFRIGYRSNAQ